MFAVDCLNKICMYVWSFMVLCGRLNKLAVIKIVTAALLLICRAVFIKEGRMSLYYDIFIYSERILPTLR